MTLYKWSKTAASNSTADSTINWAEGQAPSSVNDSARATMAAVAKYRDDSSGTLVPGGTANAITITSNQVFDSLANMNGAKISFTPGLTNTGAVTLNVDGLGAKSVVSIYGTSLEAGALIANVPVCLTYFNAITSWLMQGAAPPPQIAPLGVVLPYAGSTAPNSYYLLCNGAAVSRTTYAGLFALLSTTYGAGDGSTTFNLPDMRGRVPAGNDTMGSSAASRLTATYFGASGSTNGNTGGGESVTLLTANLPVHTPSGTISAITPAGTITYASTYKPAGTVAYANTYKPAGTVAYASNFTPAGTVTKPTITITEPNGGLGHQHTLGDGFDASANGTFTTGGTTAVINVSAAGAGATDFHTSGVTAALDTTPVFTGTSVALPALTFDGTTVNLPALTFDGTTVNLPTATFAGNAVTPTFTGNSIGSATPTAIVQPTIILNYIIRAL